MAAKKTFSDYLPNPVNPAAMFRSEPAAEEKPAKRQTMKKQPPKKAGVKPIDSSFPEISYDEGSALYSKETKSRRVQLLIQPGLYEEGKQRAEDLGIRSFNDYITQLVQNDLEHAKEGAADK